MAPPDFGRSVNPISTRGTDYAHLITTGTPGFSDLPTALAYVINSQKPDIRLGPWTITHEMHLPQHAGVLNHYTTIV